MDKSEKKNFYYSYPQCFKYDNGPDEISAG